jgi:hypothetical protein
MFVFYNKAWRHPNAPDLASEAIAGEIAPRGPAALPMYICTFSTVVLRAGSAG